MGLGGHFKIVQTEDTKLDFYFSWFRAGNPTTGSVCLQLKCNIPAKPHTSSLQTCCSSVIPPSDACNKMGLVILDFPFPMLSLLTLHPSPATAPHFCSLYSKTSLKRCFHHLCVLASHSLWCRLWADGSHPSLWRRSPNLTPQQHWAHPSLPPSEAPWFSPSRHLAPLILSFLIGCSFLASFACSSFFFSWISKCWNSAGLSSWSSSLFYLPFVP